MKNILLACCLWLLTLSAHATLISIDIEDKYYGIGDTLTADIYISEINNGFQELIAEFYFDLNSPDSLLTFSSITFGDKLRAFSDLDSDQYVDSSVANTISISEFSYLLWDEFPQEDLGAFILASIDFTVLTTGIAEFSLTKAGASDEWGTPYIVSTQSASITLGKVAEVPEPNTIILMFISLFGCLVFSRRKLKL